MRYLPVLLLVLVAAVLAGCDNQSVMMNQQQTANAIYSTNAAVSVAINATVTGKAWTKTPAPLAMSFTATPGGEAAILSTAGLTATPATAELKAGEIDDNKLWDKYLAYRQVSRGKFTVHDVDVSERYVIAALTPDQRPVLGARVRIYGNQALLSDTYTSSSGQTLFFPKAISGAANQSTFEVVVDKGAASSTLTLKRGEQSTWSAVLRGADLAPDRPRLDVLFLLDTTGSMGDEIAQLQSNILSISRQIDALPGQPDVRYGMVLYRDRGDEYLTRTYQFTPDVTKFQQDLSQVQAGGGGDVPESLNAGLHEAIHSVEWRGDDTVKLIFLVSDAPPHLDYADDFDYAQEMVQATRQGLKIYTLAASGLDEQGEYIFRQIAQYTMGHFIFLTYAKDQNKPDQPPQGGKPGDDTAMKVAKDDYGVELLDQLVLRLIKTELAPPTQVAKQPGGP